MLNGVVPFPPEFVERYRARGYWQDQPMCDVFAAACATFANRVALVAGEQRITYAEIAARAERLALHLGRLGVQPLDRVVVQLPNVPEFVYLHLALQMVGAIPIMALPPHRYLEISHFVRLSDAIGYAVPARWREFDYAELAARIQQEQRGLRLVLIQGDDVPSNAISLSELLQTDSGLSPDTLDEISINPLDPALFLLSGGTTGVPKLIPRTHNDYVYNTRRAAEITDIQPDDAMLAVLPLAHNFPLACPGMQGFLLNGARIVLSTSTQNDDLFALIERERITHLELVPTMLIRMINDPRIHDYDLSSVRIVNTGGQRLQPEAKRRTETLIPNCLVQEVFGMAEGMLFYVRLDDSDQARIETVGRPISPADEVRLVDEAGDEAPDGEVGEVLCRGPYTLRGYFCADEHNARAFTSDGFYRTGDLMRRHPSGNYIVEGRKKDLINRGGEKISAEEVENLILAHPAVQNVACVPIPDPVLGERMCACVVLKPDAELTFDQLCAHLAARGLAKFKLPERLELFDELPLSPFGKISKQMLTKHVAEMITPTSSQ